MNKVKLIFSAIVAVVIIIAGLWAYSAIKGVPVFKLFHKENKMEQTATVLRSIKNTHQWVFLTVEDEEVVFRKHGWMEEDVAKIYPSYYELGIELDDSMKWVEIQDNNGFRVASLRLPPIKLLNENGFDDTKVKNIYGDADDAKEQIAMREEAELKLKRRAMSGDNIKQAKKSAEDHFRNLFTVLKCDSVDIKWQSSANEKNAEDPLRNLLKSAVEISGTVFDSSPQ